MTHLPASQLPKQLFAPLVKGAAQAITDYRMIEEGTG